MCLDCQSFIPKGVELLDLGCGSGIVAKAFRDFFQAKVVGVDIKDQRIFYVPLEIINGRDLPFPEKTFDTVLISYVLHHSDDPAVLLKEAKRVGRKIIIYEDLPEGFLAKIYCKLHGLTFNKFFQKGGNASFKTSEEWEKIFRETGLNIIFQKEIKKIPIKKGKLYILGA